MLVCIFCAFLIRRSSIALSAARDGVYLCLYTLIPTLFPFLVISRLMLSQGMPDKLYCILGKPFSRIFGVSPEIMTAYVVSLISGFPAGGITVAQTYKKGLCSKEEAEKALAFCGNTGPAFAVGAIGAMLGNMKYAVIIYLLQIPSSIIAARLLPSCKIMDFKNSSRRGDDITFPDALRSCVPSMGYICAFVIFFSPVLEFIRLCLYRLGVGALTASAALSFAEISGAVKYITSFLPLTKAFVLCAFAVGWSGISVLLQVRALTSDTGLKMKYYTFGKLIQGIVCAFSAIIYLGIEKLL